MDILSALHIELTNKSTLKTKRSYSQEEKLIHLLQALRYPFFNHKKKNGKNNLTQDILSLIGKKSGAGKMAQRVRVLLTKPVNLIQSLEHISWRELTPTSYPDITCTPCHAYTHTCTHTK